MATLSNYEVPIYAKNGWLEPLDGHIAADPGFADAGLRAIVDRMTRGRTFVPLEVMSVGPGRETFVAMALFGK